MTRKAVVWLVALSVATLVGCGEDAAEGGDGHVETGGVSSGGAAGAGGSSNGGGAGVSVSGGSSGALAGGASQGGLGGALVNPTITRLTPSTLTTENGSFELVVEGRDFRMDHHVAFDGNDWTPVFVSSGELRAMIPGAALGGTPRTVEVRLSRISDPALYSNIVLFEITAPP